MRHFRLLHSSEPDQRLPPRLVVAQAGENAVLDVHRDMAVQLRRKISIRALISEHPTQPE
jgi:hypothetical protein